MKFALIAMLVCASCSSASAQYLVDGSFPQRVGSFESMHNRIAVEVSDPNSLQYKGLRNIATPPLALICGWLNWRNEQGGYGPFRAFYYARLEGPSEVYISDVTAEGPVSEKLALMGCTADVLGIR